MFALGMQPTGSKDPFALRRQANGIVKTIAEKQWQLSLTDVFLNAYTGYADSPVAQKFSPVGDYEAAIRSFFAERLQHYLREVLGFAYDVVSAVMHAGAGFDDIVDVILRARAVAAVRDTPDFESISIAFKRTKNILAQAQEKGIAVPEGLEETAAGEPGEIELRRAITQALPRFNQQVLGRDYAPALSEVARLRAPIDKFFDSVMVMVDDPETRSRRLALLSTLVKQFSQIADFSEIVTEGKGS
jgi:glycyl-tRNA synthetase beta chain